MMWEQVRMSAEHNCDISFQGEEGIGSAFQKSGNIFVSTGTCKHYPETKFGSQKLSSKAVQHHPIRH
jgi:hypothetical protein